MSVGHRQTEAKSGWEIERSCYPLLHKAPLLPKTVDGLLASSLQPMATALYYIYCPNFFSSPFLSLFPWTWGCVGWVGVEVRREEGGGDDSTQWDKTNKLVKVTGSFMRSALARRLLLFTLLFLAALHAFPWAAGTPCRGIVHVTHCVFVCK